MTTASAGMITGTWTVDPTTTSAQFRARDVLRKTVVGTLQVLSGVVEVSPDGVPARVRAELDLASGTTGNARRDADLRSPRFFHVQREPVLRFTAGPATPDGPDRWVLPGQLSLKGVTCALEIIAELVEIVEGRARVRATATLDRRDVGITVPRILVGRSVAVVVDATLRAPATARE